MKKLFKIINVEFKKNKSLLTFVSILLIIGLITGSLFITILNENDKKLVLETITKYFNQIKLEQVDFVYILRTSFISNVIYILFIWLLGISILGIILILFFIFIKSFILGFSISSIIYKYNFKGILLSISYIFPHHIINTIIICFISIYALKVSLSLIQVILTKKQINFKIIMRKYLGVLLISIIFIIISSLIETFITPYFIKLILYFIK